jgi:type 1 glutamine amidotransferase
MKSFRLLLCLTLLKSAVGGAEEIPEPQRKQIFDAAPAKAQVSPQKPRKVLIWQTRPQRMLNDPHKGFCIPYGAAAFDALGRKTGAFEPVVSDDLTHFLPRNLGNFDAIVLNNSSGPWIAPLGADMAKEEFKELGVPPLAVESLLRQSLLGFVTNGGGLVIVHNAIAANPHWFEFKNLCGGIHAGQPWNEEVGVTVEDPQNPLVEAFGGKDFRIADEIYEYGPPYDRSRVRVLLSLDPATSNMGVRWMNRSDGDFPLAWVHLYGKGRVFNTSFGHRTEIFSDPRVLRFYLDAVQFACGDLQAPTEPRPIPPARNVPGTDPAPGLPGFVSLFNGRDLAGWQGDARLWSVRDGAITGETTAEIQTKEDSFLVWKDDVENFELRLKFKLQAGNSGIYFRARKRQPGETGVEALVGPQADLSADGQGTGRIMEYTLRGVLAERGQKVAIPPGGERQVAGSVAQPASLLEAVKTNDWNSYEVKAEGGKVSLWINGVTMCELDDADPRRLERGLLGLQVRTGPPMRVQFKDVYLKRL